MGDTDDFFAKKDKKKKGGLKKYSKVNTDMLVNNLEETAMKEQKPQEVNEIETEKSTTSALDQQVQNTLKNHNLG